MRVGVQAPPAFFIFAFEIAVRTPRQRHPQSGFVPKRLTTSTFLAVVAVSGCAHLPPESAPATVLAAQQTPARPVALTLSSVGEGLPRAGQWRSELAVADMNGDGRLDLVLPAPRKGDGRPRVFVAQPDGTWSRWAAMRQPAIRYDYGGVAVLDFNGDGRLDLVFGMHLRGVLAMVERNAPGEFHDESTGLNETTDGSRLMASSQSLTVLPRTGTSTARLAVIYEPMNERGAPGASIWTYQNERWLRDDVKDAPRGTHSVATPRGVAYLANGLIAHIDTGSLPYRSRILANLAGGHWHAFALSKEGNGYVAVSEYRGDAWERRVDRLPALLNTTRSAPMSPLGSPLKRAKGAAFTALAATSAAAWNMSGEILAVGDDVGELQLLRVDNNGAFEPIGALAASDWRKRCPVSNLVWTQLVAGQPPRLIATFAGEISVYDLEGGCPSNGGIDVFVLNR